MPPLLDGVQRIQDARKLFHKGLRGNNGGHVLRDSAQPLFKVHGMPKDSGMPSDCDLFCLRLQTVAAYAGVSYADCAHILREYAKHMRLGDDVMAGAKVRRKCHEDMLSQMHANPHRASALKALRALMDAEIDCIVEDVVGPWFRVPSYTRRRIWKEQRRVNWVDPTFTRSLFFPWHAHRGPRQPPNSKLIVRMYSQWRWHTPEGMAVSPVLPEEELD